MAAAAHLSNSVPIFFLFFQNFSDVAAVDSDLLEGPVAEAHPPSRGENQSAICQHDDSGIIVALQHRRSRMNHHKTATIAGINSERSSCSVGAREKATNKHPQDTAAGPTLHRRFGRERPIMRQEEKKEIGEEDECYLNMFRPCREKSSFLL